MYMYTCKACAFSRIAESVMLCSVPWWRLRFFFLRLLLESESLQLVLVSRAPLHRWFAKSPRTIGNRVLQAPAQTLEDFRSGIELIRKQFEDALAKLGLNPVPTRGEMFDPRVHEAVEIVETVSANDNHVIEELQRGYKLRDRLVRPAMVRVARNRQHGSEPEARSED